MKVFTKKWFTLTELIISIIISATVLIFVFSFIADVLAELTITNDKARVLSDLYDYKAKLDNYKSVFLSGSTVIDNVSTAGFDVLMYKNTTSTDGILIGVVDLTTKKLVPNTGFWIYGKYALAMRELTTQNITDIGVSAPTVYTYTFYDDKIFSNLIVKEFQVQRYNSNTILDMYSVLLTRFIPDYLWLNWTQVPQDSEQDIYKVNLNF